MTTAQLARETTNVASPVDCDILQDHVSALVGHKSIHEVQSDIRRAMLNQALSLTGANRTETARILGVTRQAIQHMIRELEVPVP